MSPTPPRPVAMLAVAGRGQLWDVSDPSVPRLAARLTDEIPRDDADLPLQCRARLKTCTEEDFSLIVDDNADVDAVAFSPDGETLATTLAFGAELSPVSYVAVRVR